MAKLESDTDSEQDILLSIPCFNIKNLVVILLVLKK